MKAPDFAYARPATLDAALALMAEAGGGASLLAGGQSLMPMLNFRAAAPALLIDINRLPGLDAIEEDGAAVRIGALARHAALERSDVGARHLPLVRGAMPLIAHAAIRSRGTIGGSLALADPAAELPACMVALDATIVTRSPAGERRVAAADFFTGLYATALDDTEIITAVEVPKQGERRHAIREIARRHGDFALAGVALTAAVDGRIADPRIVLFGVADRPLRATAAEAAVNGLAPGAEAGEAAADALGAFDATDDLHASSATRRHLARVLVARAVAGLAETGA